LISIGLYLQSPQWPRNFKKCARIRQLAIYSGDCTLLLTQKR